MIEKKEPYAYVAFKDDEWTGSSHPAIAKDWMVDLVAAGSTIKPVYSREEYDAEMARLK